MSTKGQEQVLELTKEGKYEVSRNGGKESGRKGGQSGGKLGTRRTCGLWRAIYVIGTEEAT